MRAEVRDGGSVFGHDGRDDSHEFTAPTDAGEDSIALCDCGYAANLEKAEGKAPPVEDLPGDAAAGTFPHARAEDDR